MQIFIRSLRIILPLAVLGLAGLLSYMIIANPPETATQTLSIEPPGVRVHIVSVRDVDLSVESQGTVRPRTESQLVPQVSGRVTWVSPSFAEGGFFEPNEVLLRIDPFDYQQALIAARSQRAQAQLRLAQEEAEAEVAQREWEELGLGNPRELTLRKPQLEDVRAAVAAAEANVQRAERDLERAEISAPYAGRIRKKQVDIGQFVTVGSSIATIYSIDVAEVRLPIPDQELAYLDLPLSYRGSTDQTGPYVAIRTTFAGKTYAWEGRIVRTEPEIDPVSRMVHVVAEVRDPYAAGQDNERPPLAVGMYVEAEIQGRQFKNIVVLPRIALQGNQRVLLIDKDDRIRFRDVEVLRSTINSVYIEQGLTKDEVVIVSNIDNPTDGMLVQVSIDNADRLADNLVDAISTTENTGDDLPYAEVPQRQAPRVRQAPRLQPPPAPPKPNNDAASETETATLLPKQPEFQPPSFVPTIAVLPFTNLGQHVKDMNIGADIAMGVTKHLTELDSVKLTSQEDKEDDVNLVIEGGIQQVGDMIRITARLINREGAAVRAIKVDGPVDELAKLQNEAITTISNNVRKLFNVVPTIAVLPFTNLGQQGKDMNLGADMTIGVAKYLTELGSVRLLPQGDNVDLVVEGGIQQVGDMIRITARLINRAGVVVQAIKVDGPVDELAKLQDEVIAAISNTLHELFNSAIDNTA